MNSPAKAGEDLRAKVARFRHEMADRGPRGTELSEDVAEFWLSATRVIRLGFHRFRDNTVEARFRGWVGERGHMEPMGNVGLNLRLTSVLDFASAFAQLLDRLEVDGYGRLGLKAAPSSPAGVGAARAPATAGTSVQATGNGSNGTTPPSASAPAEGGLPRC